MAYVDVFMAAVPSVDKDKYLAHAGSAADVFMKHGAIAYQENWGDDVPDGEVTSFPMAVKLQDGEDVVVGWAVWPDKAARDEGLPKVMSDPDIAALGPIPFDGKRLVFGGFESVITR